MTEPCGWVARLCTTVVIGRFRGLAASLVRRARGEAWRGAEGARRVDLRTSTLLYLTFTFLITTRHTGCALSSHLLSLLSRTIFHQIYESKMQLVMMHIDVPTAGLCRYCRRIRQHRWHISRGRETALSACSISLLPDTATPQQDLEEDFPRTR